MITVSRYESPLGSIIIQLENGALVAADFAGKSASRSTIYSPLPSGMKKQLDGYFDGTNKKFDVKLKIKSTPFRTKIYYAMKKIPYGKTMSYKDLAGAAGSPGAYRAAASACAANPVVLFIPCHRVIGADGTLHGYAGGLWRKKKLLEQETGKKYK